jgi:hypothetical protein
MNLSLAHIEERFIARSSRDGAEVLTPQTPFEMTVDTLSVAQTRKS